MALTICPFCQSRHVRIIATEGVRGELTLFECEECAHTWSEIVLVRRRETSKAPA